MSFVFVSQENVGSFTEAWEGSGNRILRSCKLIFSLFQCTACIWKTVQGGKLSAKYYLIEMSVPFLPYTDRKCECTFVEMGIIRFV